MDFSSRLDKVLKENNMTALQLTQKLGIGRTTINDWKRGKSTPSPNVLAEIADIFNLTLDWLITGNGNMYREINLANNKNNEALPSKSKVVFSVTGYGVPQEHFEIDTEDWEVVRAMTDVLRKKRDSERNSKNNKK